MAEGLWNSWSQDHPYHMPKQVQPRGNQKAVMELWLWQQNQLLASMGPRFMPQMSYRAEPVVRQWYSLESNHTPWMTNLDHQD